MSRNINVNPGQYKTRGRERQGEDIPHVVERARFAVAESRRAVATPGRAGTRKQPPATAKRRGRSKDR